MQFFTNFMCIFWGYSSLFQPIQPIPSHSSHFQPLPVFSSLILAYSSLFQPIKPIPANSSQLQPISACFSLFQPTSAYFSLFQPIPSYSRQFQHILAYSSLCQPISAYSSIVQHISAYFSLCQPIPTYTSLFQHILAYSSLFHNVIVTFHPSLEKICDLNIPSQSILPTEQTNNTPNIEAFICFWLMAGLGELANLEFGYYFNCRTNQSFVLCHILGTHWAYIGHILC